MHPIAPFIIFRWLFGAVVLYGGLASLLKGDIQTRFLDPVFYFKYYGWEWVQAPSAAWIYGAYTFWILGALGMMLGAWYRASVLAFGLSFSYLHFLDASNYINHYYLLSLLSIFMFFTPAQAQLSFDAWRGAAPKIAALPKAYLYSFRLQFAIVYICAGIAKLNADWLLGAMPLKIWLLQQTDFPVIGSLFSWYWTPFIFSWFGALYDLTIVFWLLWSRSRPIAYFFVLMFHIVTGLLFDIGLFPPLMMVGTLLFFSPESQQQWLSRWLRPMTDATSIAAPPRLLLYLYFAFQFLFPFRHWALYSGDLVWTEEGYRWGWRVMLFEKEGLATFYVSDPKTGQAWTVENSDFLTPFQIKQMSTKPEHIRQFAHFLATVYSRRYGIEKPIVRADVFVTHNARPSRRLVKEDVNLAAQPASFWGYDWIWRY